MVEEVGVDADRIRVILLPTFVGCPALDVIRSSVEARLRSFDRQIDVRFEYHVPWTSDRITPRWPREAPCVGVRAACRPCRTMRPCSSS